MPRQITEYRCLLISPSDVSDARDALSDLVAKWNAQIGKGLNARVELVRWESHATPEMGDEPQSILNAQIVSDCDMGIALFEARLGTRTATHESGSIEEIYRLVEDGKRVLVYFSNAPIPQDALRDGQFNDLQAVRARFEREGLLSTYVDLPDLREKVQLHLTNVVSAMLRNASAPDVVKAGEVTTAPRPDVRVSAYAAIVFDPGPFRSASPKSLVAVRVANHSPNPFFSSGVALRPKGEADKHWLLTSDAATGRSVSQRLESGQSYIVSLDPKELQGKVDLTTIDSIVVSDDIGREYVVPYDEVQRAFSDTLNGQD